jgi:hypothetical protein
MPHLTPEQFVDLAEGTGSESSLPHLAACDACRQQLADLRGMMAGAADVDVPEPSPLFWSHLSSRVRDAVAEEPARTPAWRDWVFQPRAVVAALGAALAVALVAVLLPRAVIAPAIPSTPLSIIETSTLPTSSPSMPPLAPFGAADDPQLGIVAAVATAVEWDDMRDEVALATGGSSEAVAGALTAGEQRELQRLLADEMTQPTALEHLS